MALTRKTYNFSERALDAMARLIEADNYNETDTANRALIQSAALLDYRDEDGGLTVIAPNGEKVKLVII